MTPLFTLVDLQADYLQAGPLEPAAGAVVQQAAWLLEECRRQDVPVAHVWTTVRRCPDERLAHWKQAGLWRCEAGTSGHQPPPPLMPRAGEAVIHKTGYSGYTGDLRRLVHERGIDTLILVGVYLHACVRQTILDAYQAGLAVWVAEDAVGSADPLHAVLTRRYLEARGVRFVPARVIGRELDGGQAPSPGPVDVTAAVGAAQGAAAGWRKTSPSVRGTLVRCLAERLAAQAPALAAQMAGDIGKPVRFGCVEVERSAVMLEVIARRFEALPESEAVGNAVVRRRPHGVVAVITPWNNPIYLALGKIVPAILAGNTVVWKPAPETTALSRLLADLMRAADWPDGLVVPLTGGRCVGEQLLSDGRVAAATITGSSGAGYSAQALCAQRRIPLQAELGGNNAAIICADADLAKAAQKVAAGAFEMAGQRCTANRRAIVVAERRDEFLRLLLRASAALRWGDPACSDTQIGPLVNESQRERVAGAVARAVPRCGPALLPLGAAPAHAGSTAHAWYPPTILCCADPELEIVQEETFGPVLVVQTARDWDHALRLCNGVHQGLAAAVFTRSPATADRFLEEAEAGILKVNHSTADAEVDVPFGGWKGSGIGPFEHGACDVEFYLRPQTIYGALRPADAAARAA